jgi:catechol 2,3-dioxygenase-like lactoylglutathione lyase family enzyme
MGHIKARSIDHVNMNVKDLEESVDFYKNLFGFELKKDQPDQNSQIIGNDSIKLCLYESPDPISKCGFNHYGFFVENFDEVVELCERANVEMTYGVVQWEKSRSVYILDPNGYEIELSEIEGGGL